jgi:glycosyltransferase involved in cell wall biosynthesis
MKMLLKDMKRQTLLALISTYEGFGMPILEAQAVGRAVITSNIYSMPEVAGDAAVLVDPFDILEMKTGLERIINDDKFRNEMIQRGFQNIKRFDADRIAKQYFELYKKIIS